MTRALPFALLGLLAVGCPSPSSPEADAGSGTDAPGAPLDAPIAPGTDAPLPDGGSIVTTDGGGTCEPSPGPATGDGYCDLFELGVFTFDDGAPEARLFGRLMPDGVAEGGCFVVDEVDVQRGGVTIGTLDGVGVPIPGGDNPMLARGAPLPEMTERCEGDDERFGGWGFVVRGRVEGGTFEARCADAEGGSRWPPAVRTTCHHNVVARSIASYATVSSSASFSSTMLTTFVPHEAGGALTAIDPSVHVIPGFAPAAFGPPPPMLDPFDATPFSTSVHEGTLPGTTTLSTQVSLLANAVRFPLEICPPPSTGIPMPGDPLPPVFLVHMTGTSEAGRFSTDLYVNNCYTTSS